MDEEAIRASVAELVGDAAYPCVGAKSVFHRDSVTFLVLDRLGDPGNSERLRGALARFSADHPQPTDAEAADFPSMASLVAAFRGPAPGSEEEFERLLWRQLGLLHEVDAAPWDPQVSSDPADPHFGFSVAGRAFFVIGMHPAASRLARRTALPVLVFNLHSQFEQLRASGHYDRLRDTVRRRDTLLQGCVNPMVADHGRRSEARQYSGRSVPDDWQPPLEFPAPRPEGAS